jgi:trehalose 6-phosphate phosphatase
MNYLFSESGLKAFEEYCDQDTLFAFDYDGTLTEIVADPGATRTPKAIEDLIYEMADLAPVAVISGRGLRDLQERFDQKRVFLIGNHGIEGIVIHDISEFKNASAGWVDQLTQYFVDHDMSDEVLIENKLFSLSVHYRKSPEPVKTREKILKAVERLSPVPRIIFGDYVINVVPQAAPHKGHALLDLMKETGVHKAVFLGDDQTDEDVFGLNGTKLLTVKVRSPGPAPVPSRAQYYLHSQSEMLGLLQKIVQSLKA